ncbi:MAG: Ig-like domain-containing protein [Aquisalinus sp.]|nr:Ig-like domain-containing protein [Aquisalinus sp.]
MLKEGGIFLSSRFSSEISNYFRAGSENFSSLFKFDRLDLSIDFLPFEPAIVVPPVPDTEVTSGRKIIPLVDANEILKGDDEQALPGPGEPVNPSKDVISLYDSRDDFKFLAVGEADAGKVLSVISDDNKGSDAAIVTVTLNGRSDVFKANDDVLNVGGGLGGGWLNDDTETDPMKLFSTPGHGGADVYAGNEFAHESSDLVAVNASGSWVYDPGVRVDGILVGQSSVSEFDYFADDGGFEGAMVLVKALAQNAAPVASDDDFTTDENTSINGNLFIFNGVGFDQDADAGDSFSLTALNGDALSVGQQVILPSGALLLLAVDGSFSYDPNGQFESLGVGETTTDIFNYTISDSNGASSAATVTIAIVGVNDVPVALDDEYSLVEDEQILDGTIFRDVGGIGDFDFDINDNLSVVSVNGSEASIGKEVVLASGALLTLNADGTFVYNTNGKFAALDTGQAFVEEFTYAITDGQLDQVAATFDPDILPSSLDGTAGYTINGNGFQFGSGRVVSSAGDFNADGVDDFLISAANQVSVVFGQSGESVVDFELSDLNGVNGFKINAIERFDQFGRSISSAGDMNGDGFDDIIIGAGFADGAFSGAGESYVVFGTSTPFLPTFDLTDLDGTNGFVLDGSVFNGQSGIAVANIGDLNGDGLQDIAVSAPFAGVGGETAGQIYIVYGRLDPFPARFSVSELDGANGFTINGIDNRDNIGNTKDSISGAGDVNGDGVDDMLVGAIFGGSPLNSGESYIVFGATGDRSASLFLSDLNGTNG